MLLNKITVNNVGVFSGKHEIDLKPKVMKKNAKPIILFGGMNGSGKTTIFDAIKLCLYGSEMFPGKNIHEYNKYLKKRDIKFLFRREEEVAVTKTNKNIISAKSDRRVLDFSLIELLFKNQPKVIDSIISDEKIEKMINEIEEQIRKKGKKEIRSTTIGELVMRKIRKLDNVAYIRFASVYRNFQDVSDFKKEIRGLK